MPTKAEIAWAAGLFEGEGCARVRRDRRTHDYISPYVNLRMTDEGPVREFARIVGFGHINRRKNGSGLPHHKDLWCWESGSKQDVPRMKILLPYLFSRRKAAVEAAIEACAPSDPVLKGKRISEAQAKRPLKFCECGFGPSRDGPLGRHRKACKEVVSDEGVPRAS